MSLYTVLDLFCFVLFCYLAMKVGKSGLPGKIGTVGRSDFVTGRQQRVRYSNLLSEVIMCNTGTPQGCVLSPTLFTFIFQ